MARSKTTSLDPDVRLLQALGDPTRLAIVRQLAEADEVCACDFTACCDVAQPTVSHHLKVLREAGWVTSERRGTWIWYRLRPDAVARLAGVLGHPDRRDGRSLPVLPATPAAARSVADAAGASAR